MQGRQVFPPGRGCGLGSQEACLWRQESALGHQEALLLLSMFLGPECHPLESSSLRDAGSEWALENCRGLWHWGEAEGRGSHRPGCKALGGGFPQAFLITGVISAPQIMWFLHLA